MLLETTIKHCWNLTSLSPLLQIPNATPKGPRMVPLQRNSWSFSTRNPRSWMWKHGHFQESGQHTQWLREFIFHFIFKEMLCKSSFHKSCSQRTLISCELFFYEHHKQMSTRKREFSKSGCSFWVSRRSLSGSTKRNLVSPLIKMRCSSSLA